MTHSADYLVIGGGIAGASVGYWLAQRGRVILLERESQPGYHATGRSAAQYIASYGTPQVQALTRASRDFFERPPPYFCEAPILTPRDTLLIGAPGQEHQLDAAWHNVQAAGLGGRRLDAHAACAIVPALRREAVCGGVLLSDAFDMDVSTLHQGYLNGMKRHGGQIVTNAEVTSLRYANEIWQVVADGITYRAPVVINAAGAWCDIVAAMAGVPPIDIIPRRRSAFTFKAPEGMLVHDWPMVMTVDETCYFKPDAGMLLGSPANADETKPQDLQPEEFDIAMGMHQIETLTTLSVRPAHTWAGLRSFVADGDLVGGFDPEAVGFFWLAAQGGYGIQTSAAMGEACAALAAGEPLPKRIAEFGLTASMLSPARLRN